MHNHLWNNLPQASLILKLNFFYLLSKGLQGILQDAERQNELRVQRANMVSVGQLVEYQLKCIVCIVTLKNDMTDKAQKLKLVVAMTYSHC